MRSRKENKLDKSLKNVLFYRRTWDLTDSQDLEKGSKFVHLQRGIWGRMRQREGRWTMLWDCITYQSYVLILHYRQKMIHYKKLKTSIRSFWQVRVQLPHDRVRQRNLSFHRRLLKKISLCTHTLSGQEIGTS